MPCLNLPTGHIVQFDECDRGLISSATWRGKANSKSKRRFYAQARIGDRYVYMHRLIVGAARGEIVDHINGDSLDNRRVNLRIVDVRVNRINWRTILNKSGLYGIYTEGDRYRAAVQRAGKRIQSKRVRSDIEAAFIYDQLAHEVHGPEARLNFPCVERSAKIGEAA